MSQSPPVAGSKVRLVGLKDPALNQRVGHVHKYTRDGARVKIRLADGSDDVVRVRPGQVEVLEDAEAGPGGGAAAPGLHRRKSEKKKKKKKREERPGVGADDAADDARDRMDALRTLRKAERMFELTDASGDGLIDQDEFEHYMKRQTRLSARKIRAVFDAIDVDGSGEISRAEASAAFLAKSKESAAYADTAKSLDDTMAPDEELRARHRRAHVGPGLELLETLPGEGSHRDTLKEILHLEDDEMADIEDDVYNMFFLAEVGSASFFFGIFVFLVKIGLMTIIAIDLAQTGFPKEDVGALVKFLQFILLFVNVAFQEELIATFYIYANLKWSKHILKLNRGATKRKYHTANAMRFLDGLLFLTVNTALLFQATKPIGAMLNFAALMFLSQVDNQALTLARDGYLADSMETVAGDVLLMKLPKNHNESLQKMDTILLGVVLLIQFVAWIAVVII